MKTQVSRIESPAYQLFMLVLCVYTLTALALKTLLSIEPRVMAILDYADYAVCLLFFIDFLASLHRAENKWQYFIKWGWLDLISSVPAVDALRWGRAARVLRIIRVLRALRAARVIAETLLRRRAENAFLAICLTAILLIVFASIGILQFENAPNSNIKKPEDAIWWSLTTVMTGGSAELYPVTSEGKTLAVVLMFAGLCIIGTITGLFTAWVLLPQEKRQDSEMVVVRQEIQALRLLLEEWKTKQDGDQSVG